MSSVSASGAIEPPLVAIVDDDAEIRIALESLLRSVGFRVAQFASVRDFLARDSELELDALILDVRLPGQSGLDFFDELGGSQIGCPVIFITGHGDIPMSVRAMKGGAIEFLTKPVRHQDLLDALQVAVQQGRLRRDHERTVAKLRANFDTLTAREREVLNLVIHGRRNKEIAAEIGISEATVKLHRGHVMQKTKAESLADLIRMADKLRATNLPREP